MFLTSSFIRAKKWRKLQCPPTGEWIRKTWLVHIWGSCLNNKKLWSANPCYNTDDPWKHANKQKQPVFHDSIYVKCLEQANSQRQNVDGWLPASEKGWRAMGSDHLWEQGCFGDNETALKCDGCTTWNVLNTTELYVLNGGILCCVIYVSKSFFEGWREWKNAPLPWFSPIPVFLSPVCDSWSWASCM